MLVRCVHNTLESAARDALELASLRSAIHLDELPLVIGRSYQVFAIAQSLGEDRLGEPHYYICPYESDEYPTPYAAAFFTVEDVSVPPDWEAQQLGDLRLTSFKAWARDPDFYERLIDGDPEAVAAFLAAQARARPAPPEPSAAAIALDTDWVQCPECLEAWEQTTAERVLTCPACGVALRSPKVHA